MIAWGVPVFLITRFMDVWVSVVMVTVIYCHSPVPVKVFIAVVSMSSVMAINMVVPSGV